MPWGPDSSLANRARATTALALLALASFACGGGSGGTPTSPPPTVDRRFAMHLRAPSSVSFTARFLLDGIDQGPPIASVVAGSTSIVDAALPATQLAPGRHHVRAQIESLSTTSAEFRFTGSVSENNRTVVPDVPDVIAVLRSGEAIEVAISF